MPAYEYRCRPCGWRGEVVKGMGEAGRAEACPACGRPATRVFSLSRQIVRPSGYNRRPGERGFDDFRREQELGELGLTVPAGEGERIAAWAESQFPEREPDWDAGLTTAAREAAEQKLHEIVAHNLDFLADRDAVRAAARELREAGAPEGGRDGGAAAG